MAYAAYISVGSCATQFFLIRLFSLQASGKSSVKIPYLILILAVTIYDNWYLLDALRRGLPFAIGDIAHLVFDLLLTVLILIAIMINSHVLGVFCGLGALAMTAYNIWLIMHLNGTISNALAMGITLCEALYGIGLALCLFGIRKPVETAE